MGVGTLLGIIGGLLILGGAFGYLFWLFTRPKKMTWEARVWQLSDAQKDIKLDNLHSWSLQDMKPYTKDILEQVEPEPGAVIHRLRKLDKTCPKPSAGTVEKWGDIPEVNVLFHQGSCTLLQKAYDKKSGQMLFSPISYETTTMIQHQIITRKAKLQREKDILQSITPWIVTGIAMLALVACAYIMTQGWLTMTDKIAESQRYHDDKSVESANIFREALLDYRNAEQWQQNQTRLPSGSGVPGIT